MLNENTTSAILAARANVGLTAFRVAVVQARAFEEQLKEVNDHKAEEVRAEKARAEEKNAAEQSQESRGAQAEERGGIDIVVDESRQSGASQLANEVNTSSKGQEVDIEV